MINGTTDQLELEKIDTPAKLLPKAYRGRACGTRVFGKHCMIIASDDEALLEIWGQTGAIAPLDISQVKTVLICGEKNE